MNEVTDLTAEATGETVGEAKWAALRELERRHPGLDKAAVQFEVVAEGERGILGVGYEPARVARASAGRGRRRLQRPSRATRLDQAADARGSRGADRDDARHRRGGRRPRGARTRS